MVRLYERFIVFCIFAVADPNPRSLIIGSALSFAGIVLRIWTRGYPIEDRATAVFGPYRFVRHPHHLGTFLMLLGFCIAARSFAVTCLMLAGCLILFRFIFREESFLLGRKGGILYKDYQMRVPTMIPNLIPYSGPLCKNNAFSLGHSMLKGPRREFETPVVAIFVYSLLFGLTKMTETGYWRIAMSIGALVYGILSLGVYLKRPRED